MNRTDDTTKYSWKSNMRRLMKGIAVLSAWLATSISTAEATSFDCTKAQNFAEMTICSSPALQRADEDVNSAYVKAVDRVPDNQKADVRQSQRSWLKRRNACTTTSCISVAMTEQLRTLAHWGAEPGAAPVAKPAAFTSPVPAAARQAPKAISPATQEEFDINRGAPSAVIPEVHPATALTSETAEQGPAHPTQDMRPFKIALVAMVALLLVCIWLHSRGSMVIYSDLTDALWTTLTPVLAIGAFFLARWLELSEAVAGWSALAVFSLMSLQVLIQTFRSNGFSPYFILALYAKIALFILFFFLMALLLLGGYTKADRRRRRSWAVAAAALFAFFTAWMCRNRSFSHIDDYLAGRA
ncbi:lysozyme inhibitor LprI family protein [Pseudomonas sp. NY15437]|uniref:lysozyme inhibitor LprI family protein n=1 Tax=Pseudomonas sp. NY15437 TaxID=3400360 RepID=UPI003A88FEF2